MGVIFLTNPFFFFLFFSGSYAINGRRTCTFMKPLNFHVKAKVPAQTN